MKKVLKLKNIGKLENAEIDLEGITVICGENNSGKSTVGKALYNIYYSFLDSEKNINDIICKSLKVEFFLWWNTVNAFFKSTDNAHLATNVSLLFSKYKSRINSAKTVSGLQRLFYEVFAALRDICRTEASPAFSRAIDSMENEFRESIDKVLNTPDTEIFKYGISERTVDIFHGQLTKISCDNAFIQLIGDTEKDTPVEISYSSNDRCEECTPNYHNVTVDELPIYIDNPHTVDLLCGTFSKSRALVKGVLSPAVNSYEAYGKVASLSKLQINNKIKAEKKATSPIAIIERNNKTDEVIKYLNEILNGKFIEESDTIRFQEKHVSVPLDIRNLSTGVKSMALLERCLSLGIIKEGSTLILDEPEIHLHPEWQLKYAEFVIILQKALNLTVLITTHSPQFLRAVECYMDKYGVMDRLNVYSIENGKATNASYSEYGISEIYEKLSEPYNVLQQMLDEKYGEADD